MLQHVLNRKVKNTSSKPTNNPQQTIGTTEKCGHKNKFKLNKLPT